LVAAHSFFSHSPGAHLPLHSFPTRRSSDLSPRPTPPAAWRKRSRLSTSVTSRRSAPPPAPACSDSAPGSAPSKASSPRTRRTGRSEEHTSELQSRENLVCRLLLEKKKTRQL